MKKIIISAILIISLPTVILGIWLFLSGDRQNKIERKRIEYLDSNYKVTYACDSFQKTWKVTSGKITSEPKKGYYLFFSDCGNKKCYVQTPIEHSFIEEIK